MHEVEHTLSRCEVFDEFASGGMAAIHLGQIVGASGFTRTVAVKRLHPQFARDAQFVDMFLDEARMVARIRHPNVVATLDLIEEQGSLLIVMEYVEGLSLRELQNAASERGERLPSGIAARIVADALHGLHAAHEARDEHGLPLGLVHRDVSPENILVGVDGHPRVLDFGVARALGRISVTQRGQVKGKLSYMAPEQLVGEPLDRRADVFAASAVLWQALTGERLFTGSSPEDLARRLLAREVEPPSQVAPDVPKRFDSIVLRGLATAPAKRWKSAMAMAEALESVGGLASHREVGVWVRRMGAARLRAMAAKVSRLERQELTGSLRPKRRGEPPSPLATTPAEIDAPRAGAPAELAQSTPPAVAQTAARPVAAAKGGQLWQPLVAAALIAVAVMVALGSHGTPRIGARADGAPAGAGSSSPDSLALSALPASPPPTPRFVAPEPSSDNAAPPESSTPAKTSTVVSAPAGKTAPAPRPASAAVPSPNTAKSSDPEQKGRNDDVLPLYGRH